MKKNNHKKVLSFLVLLSIVSSFTACTSTKHILKRTTEKIKVYEKSEVVSSYEMDEYQSDMELDANVST